MDERDLELRNVTYAAFVDLGRAPVAAEVTEAAGLEPSVAVDGPRRLDEAHQAILDRLGLTGEFWRSPGA